MAQVIEYYYKNFKMKEEKVQEKASSESESSEPAPRTLRRGRKRRKELKYYNVSVVIENLL